ncbi:hypothetical protein [Nonomuraea sediminis]|uniref:hypothetical protein n=1 Tax=Nonomuraea sediminis TaxID=2835864 RepID=UPI001BDDB1EE|nr:hypothetical protein [Nonomuraea sediminis]
MKPSLTRTALGGLTGGVALCAGLYVTFARFGCSSRGETGLLFDPATQSPKLIAIWKDIEPLPLLVDHPLVILAGYFAFATGYSFVYRSVATAWPSGKWKRVWRLAALIWLTAAFFEFQGPVNLAHQPVLPLAIALSFWAVAALAEALAIVLTVGAQPAPARAWPPPVLTAASASAPAQLVGKRSKVDQHDQPSQNDRFKDQQPARGSNRDSSLASSPVAPTQLLTSIEHSGSAWQRTDHW